jgi:hypothetical protein
MTRVTHQIGPRVIPYFCHVAVDSIVQRLGTLEDSRHKKWGRGLLKAKESISALDYSRHVVQDPKVQRLGTLEILSVGYLGRELPKARVNLHH